LSSGRAAGPAIAAFVLGRLHADLYPLQVGVSLDRVETFQRFLGGFAGNVAVGLARLGVRSAVLSGVGDDGLGRYILRTLAEEGVDTSGIRTDPVLRTALTFCELHPPDYFPLTAYRLPTCPVMLHYGELDKNIPRERIEQVRAVFPQGIYYFYPADHGFNCDARASYDAPSAKLAWERTQDFLKVHIG